MPKEPTETLQNRLDYAALVPGGTVYTRGPVLGPVTVPAGVQLRLSGRQEPEHEGHQRRWFAFLAARIEEAKLEAELSEKTALTKRAAARSLQAQYDTERAVFSGEEHLDGWPEAAQAYQVCREAELEVEWRLNRFVVTVLAPAKTQVDSHTDFPKSVQT